MNHRALKQQCLPCMNWQIPPIKRHKSGLKIPLLFLIRASIRMGATGMLTSIANTAIKFPTPTLIRKNTMSHGREDEQIITYLI